MLRVICLFLSFSFLVGCATSEKGGNTPEVMFKKAQEFENDDRYEEAIRRYQEVRSKFPYSPQAIEAELAVADVYYKQESFPEAQAAYQSFRDLRPKHPKLAYVYYRLAMSLHQQIPTTIDRDLSLVPETIVAFNDVVKKFPQSEFSTDSEKKRSELVKMMGEKEVYIADFYYKKKMYQSALARDEYILQEYKGLGFDEKALARAAYSAHKTGHPQKMRTYADRVQAFSNKSTETKEILREIR